MKKFHQNLHDQSDIGSAYIQYFLIAITALSNIIIAVAAWFGALLTEYGIYKSTRIQREVA